MNLAIALDGIQVTKSDATIYSPPLRGVWVGGTGNVQVVTQNGTTLLFSAVPAGTLLPISAAQVMNTNTTATLLVGLL